MESIVTVFWSILAKDNIKKLELSLKSTLDFLFGLMPWNWVSPLNIIKCPPSTSNHFTADFLSLIVGSGI